MGVIRDFLDEHLHDMFGPYLFVGAGFSRRYAGLPSWPDLLLEFAEKTGQPFNRYLSAGNDDLPSAASRLAEVFQDTWWESDAYAASRQKWEAEVRRVADALKIEIAESLRQRLVDWSPSSDLSEEWALVQKATVDGVITTNYDSLLSVAFPEYKVFVGQEGLLFSDTQGVAEIYAIHGAVADPHSLVLTAEDYKDYEGRNAYLAAKLMTIFVEHPVIFLGYGFGDANVQSMLLSLVKGLKEKSVDKLRDRLLFVEWHAALESGPYVEHTHYNVDGRLLPIIRLHVTDWVDVLSALGERQHAYSARALRHLKEQVYDIVLTNDPKGRLYALTDIDAENAKDVDIVFGVGAKMAVVGIVGLKRDDLFVDVLEKPEGNYPAKEIVDRLLPTITARTWTPIYKYLRRAGLLDEHGEVLDGAYLPPKVATRVTVYKRVLELELTGVARTDFATLLIDHDDRWIFGEALSILAYTHDADGFRGYLLGAARDLASVNAWWGAQYAKLIVSYDYLHYGLQG